MVGFPLSQRRLRHVYAGNLITHISPKILKFEIFEKDTKIGGKNLVFVFDVKVQVLCGLLRKAELC